MGPDWQGRALRRRRSSRAPHSDIGIREGSTDRADSREKPTESLLRFVFGCLGRCQPIPSVWLRAVQSGENGMAARYSISGSFMVGARGFEPPTPCPPEVKADYNFRLSCNCLMGGAHFASGLLSGLGVALQSLSNIVHRDMRIKLGSGDASIGADRLAGGQGQHLARRPRKGLACHRRGAAVREWLCGRG